MADHPIDLRVMEISELQALTNAEDQLGENKMCSVAAVNAQVSMAYEAFMTHLTRVHRSCMRIPMKSLLIF